MDQPSLRALLGRRDLGLRLVSEALPPEALDRPLRWVHSSDLADPTPFLADDLALLTTGSQLDGPVTASVYVAQLSARGVVGLGFGTGVRHPEVPADLVAACTASGLPLFEVPYRTPFIAVARAHAEAIAAQAYARRSWALDTQRALAVAALRRHGLAAIISELGRRLGAWVAMFDASGTLTFEHPPGGIAAATREVVAAHVAEVLTRGAETGRSIVVDEQTMQLFTLGRRRGLRGVIAIAAPALDAEARAVVTSVIAMAGLALEQNDQFVSERRRLHTQLLRSLLLDDATLAQRVLSSLPTGQIIVAVAVDALPEALEEWWERRRAERGSRSFLASADEGVVICLPEADAVLLDEAAERFGIRIGVSDSASYAEFSRAHAQAISALRRGAGAGGAGGAGGGTGGGGAAGGYGAIRFADAVESGILSALTTDDARLIAQSRLAPLRDRDAGHDADLEQSLRVWLEHDARFEAAAAALGIHRHTLRSRVAQASKLLEMDLSTFPARAELWALLQASRA
ncbi:PucR family transcriptional regulator [Microbacterium sp. A94]|uniref:PucR family transcriptional regulator n=1 Tax=Microbacterium sp. A94 TaxID=3450717 RepID=UPI003F424824